VSKNLQEMGSKCYLRACEDMGEGAILDLIAKGFGICLSIRDACTAALNGIDLPSLVKESEIIMRQMPLFGLSKGSARKIMLFPQSVLAIKMRSFF
jgi:hypothetical protein